MEGAAPRRGGCIGIIIAAVVLLFAARSLATLAIDYQWWREMGQLETWLNLWLYSVLPTAAAIALAFAVLFISHHRGLCFAGVFLREHKTYAWISTIALLALAALIGFANTENWTVVRYFGGRLTPAPPNEYHDPVFGLPLSFFFFSLPFYSLLLSLVLSIAVVSALVHWLTVRAWQIRANLPRDWSKLQGISFDIHDLGLRHALESRFIRGLLSVFLIALALRFYLSRYSMLFNDHGFMVGIDYVNQYIGLPLQWLLIAACVLGAISIAFGRKLPLALVLVAFVLRAVLPSIVSAAYVRPNEISLERPFIDRHIQATRAAYGLDRRTDEVAVQATPDAVVDYAANKALLDNVRLWDWKAFRETVSQIQPLRPYVYSDVDIDRYILNGQLRQVMVAPRELDLNGLGEARTRWINPHFIYTHGYGLVMAEANRITPNGLPILFVKDAPPEISVPGLKLTKPQIYFGEQTEEPVFVRTAQPEFDYPAGEHNVQTRYDGKGGFPISTFIQRVAAAVAYSDWNILLTGYLTPQSRMMIRRKIPERLHELAGFVSWDPDAYMVVGDNGRMFWIVDGYMTSDAHPYSRDLEFESGSPLNYIRNSVKATVDAYDGTTNLYVFDDRDPLIAAYRNLFPKLLKPASEMPADARRHVRYPEVIFRAQAEIYRTFHMRDPETFYNKSDAWDIAKFTSGQGTTPEPVAPNYVIATVPGQSQPEFLLMIPFTPRNRDNLIGLMMARCDGEHLGQKVVLLLSKQEIVLGPMQVDARINQDQNISKDLTLWNQQGSQVLRGQMLVLPIGGNFLYVQPIYLQAAQAKMPQLKKVALAMGNNLVYADTYSEALTELGGGAGQTEAAVPPQGNPPTTGPTPAGQAASPVDPRIQQIRDHLTRYRELVSQGKWADAGRELEAVQSLVGK